MNTSCFSLPGLALAMLTGLAQAQVPAQAPIPVGDVERGRLAFAACRTCHPQAYADWLAAKDSDPDDKAP